MADFSHLGDDVQRLVRVLRGAMKARAQGVVVILYGPPGTGKTELAKTLAASLKVPLHAIGETDDCGGDPTRNERLYELQFVQKLLTGSTPALLLFDEAEDLFGLQMDFLGNPRAQVGSRAFMHRLLEGGTMPVIMTANSLAAFGDAILRRACCCVEVKVPPAEVRAEIWTRAAKEQGVRIRRHELEKLARQLPASPGVGYERNANRKMGRW
jgi:AAA+ superfamily predicted ATPase